MYGDELATRVVKHFRAVFDDAEIHLEEPYDHYGNRDVADVYARVWTPEPVDYFTELKADAAVHHAIDTNEILRRRRRMERYFYEDDEHAIQTKLGCEGPDVHALLLLTPAKCCVGHVRGHAALYKSVDSDTTIGDVETAYKVASLTDPDRAPEGELGFLSLNGPLAFDSVAFREAVPPGSWLADVLWGGD